MAWLLLDELEVTIVSENARRTPVRSGGYRRAFDGTLRSNVRAEKLEWEVTTAPLDEEDATAVEAALADGVTVELGGDIVGTGNEVDVKGTVTASRYVHHGTGHRRELDLILQQV